MQNISLNVKPLSAKGISFLIFGLALIAVPALAQSIINLSLIMLNIKLSLPTTIALIQNMTWINLIPKAVGLALVSALVIRSHLKVDAPKTKRQITKVSIIGLTGLMLLGVCAVETPFASAQATALTGYILDTPLPIADWYIGTYGTNNYFAINGSNWDNLMRGVGSTAWSSYASNYTKVEELVLAQVTSGSVYLKDVPFNLALMGDIPENTQVICNYQGVTYTYANPLDTVGSPYTVSVGEGPNTGYYLAADSKDRILWSSTNFDSVWESVITNSNNKHIVISEGTYLHSYLPIIGRQNVTITGSGQGVTIFEDKSTTLTYPPTFAVSIPSIFISESKQISISGITISGLYNATRDYGRDGIRISNSSDVSIFDNEIKGIQGVGIKIDASLSSSPNPSNLDSFPINNLRIQKNYIHHLLNVDHEKYIVAYGIDVGNTNTAIISDNIIQYTEDSPIRTHYSINLVIDKNLITGSGTEPDGNGIDIYATAYTTISNNNIFKTFSGIYVWDNSSDLIISHNIVQQVNPDKYSFKISSNIGTGTQNYVANVTVDHNTFNNGLEVSMNNLTDVTFDTNCINGNFTLKAGQSSLKTGNLAIKAVGNTLYKLSYNTISDYSIDFTGNTVYGGLTFNNMTYVDVTNNEFRGSYQSSISALIFMYNITRITVSNNEITRYAWEGIIAYPTVPTITVITIDNNKIFNTPQQNDKDAINIQAGANQYCYITSNIIGNNTEIRRAITINAYTYGIATHNIVNATILAGTSAIAQNNP